MTDAVVTFQGKEIPDGMRLRMNPFTGQDELVPIRIMTPKPVVPVDLVDAPPKPKAKPASTKGGKKAAASTVSKAAGKAKDAKKGKKAPSKQNEAPTSLDAVVEEMARLRSQFADLDNGHRSGAKGQTMVSRYRYLTLAHSKLSPEGTEAPPKLWDDIGDANG